MSDAIKRPANITPDIFTAWRAPRYGSTNPEKLNNPLWEWLTATRMDAYSARKSFFALMALLFASLKTVIACK
jgi:hypothetical protein